MCEPWQREPFDAVAVATRLASPAGPAAAVEVVDQIDSTSVELARRADPAHFTVLVAEYQTEGRGRGDRRWSSPPRAGVTASVVLGDLTPETVRWLPIVGALAVADALRSAGLAPRLKWPNDVVVAAPDSAPVAGWGRWRKLAGLLATAYGDGAILGFGVNALQDENELACAWATSVRIAGGEADRVDLLARTLTSLAARLDDFDADATRREADRLLVGAGEPVSVRLPDGDIEGRAVGLDMDGALRLLDDDGAFRSVEAGDLSLTRW